MKQQAREWLIVPAKPYAHAKSGMGEDLTLLDALSIVPATSPVDDSAAAAPVTPTHRLGAGLGF